jgi:addiction module HigA family antidote
MALKMHPALSVHVGEWLRAEIVEPAGMSVTDLAAHLGVSRQALSNFLNGKAGLSADMAIRFEKGFGVKADTLMRMQATYDLAQARANERAIKVRRLSSAA